MKKYTPFLLLFSLFFGSMQLVHAQFRPYPEPVFDDVDISYPEDPIGNPGDTSDWLNGDPNVDFIGNPVSCCEGPGNEFRFDLRFDDFYDLLRLENALRAAYYEAKQKWLREQETKFLGEINRQLGEEFTEFKKAQKEYFKTYELENENLKTNVRSYASKFSSEAITTKGKIEEALDNTIILQAFENCGYCSSLSDIIIDGKRLGDLDHDSGPGFHFWIPQLKKTAQLNFYENQAAYGIKKQFADGLYGLSENIEEKAYEIAAGRQNYYNSLNWEDKVLHMTAYLIAGNNAYGAPYQLPNGIYTALPLSYQSDERFSDWSIKYRDEIPREFSIFTENYLNNLIGYEGNYFGNVQWDIHVANITNQVEAERNEIFEQKLNEKDFYRDFPIYEMQSIYNAMELGLNDCPDCKYFNGSVGGSTLNELKYFRYREGYGGSRYYNLNNGLWIGEFGVPQVTAGEQFPTGLQHTNGAYYYLFEPSLNGWVPFDIPVENEGFLRIDDYIGPFLLETAKGFVSIATPVEDFIIIVTGKDFNGIDQSRLEAGVWFVVGFVPGAKAGKFLKPVLSSFPRNGVAKLIKIGNTYVVRFVKELSQAVISRIINFIDSYGFTRLKESLKRLDYYPDLIEDNIEEIAEAFSRKGSKLTWPELKKLLDRGNAFNDKVRTSGKYPVSELNLIDGKRLDSYVPGKEIISRKATDLDKIKFSTFEKYVNEILQKYPRGKKIRSKTYDWLDGQTLQGEYILEIPATNQYFWDIQKFINYAKKKGIKIRFTSE